MIDVTFKNDTWVDAFRLGHNVRQAGPVRIYETSSVCLPKRFFKNTKLY